MLSLFLISSFNSSISLYLDFKSVSSASRSSSLSSNGITSPSITTLSSLISKLPDLTCLRSSLKSLYPKLKSPTVVSKFSPKVFKFNKSSSILFTEKPILLQ